MIIQNEIRTREIELWIIESVIGSFPTTRLGFRIKTEEFEGSFDRNIWIVNADIKETIEQMEKLEQTRYGKAILNSISPGEFHLQFRNIDAQGHLAVEFHISKEPFRNSYGDKLRVEFEIDPTSLPGIILEFEKLKTTANKGYKAST